MERKCCRTGQDGPKYQPNLTGSGCVIVGTSSSDYFFCSRSNEKHYLSKEETYFPMDNTVDFSIFHEGDITNRFSEELVGLMDYLRDTVLVDNRILSATPDSLVVAMLNYPDTKIYRLLDRTLTFYIVNTINDTFSNILSMKSLSAIKPGRKSGMGPDLLDIVNSIITSDKDKLDTLDLFLALIRKNEKIRKVFDKVGVSENLILSKISDDANAAKKTTVSIEGSTADITFAGPSPFSGISTPRQKNSLDIEQYCINLNALAGKGEIGEAIGREKELMEIVRILGRRKKNNAILVGASGVGKTAIGEGLAYMIESGDCPGFLKDKEVLSLNMTALIAGTTLVGMIEQRVQSLLSALEKEKKYILFVDDLSSAFDHQGGGNSLSIATMLSSALEDGVVQMVGTTSFEGYRNTFDANPNLSRKFQRVNIEAPDRNGTLAILEGIVENYEKFHKVKYTKEALRACVELGEKYITDRNLPDSAVDLMDEAGSAKAIERLPGDNIKAKKRRRAKLNDVIENMRDNADFKSANEKQAEMDKLTVEIAESEKKCSQEPQSIDLVDADDIYEAVFVKTGIPTSRLSTGEKERILNLNKSIKQSVIGQDAAIDSICKAIKRNSVGLRENKTIASLFLLGKSGVGKTLVAKTLAKEMFGSEKNMVRIDMSEYNDQTATNKLIGSSAGYVGYDRGGILTEAIKNKRYCVLLLDEMEKASKEVYNLFLQVFDEGWLSDNTGQRIDFKNVIVLMTSNVGVKDAAEYGKGLGFNENVEENSKRIIDKELKKKFPPEFINRLDEVVIFNGLKDEDLRKIIDLEISKLKKRVQNIGFVLNTDSDINDVILNKVQNSKEYGARPIARTIQTEIEDNISDLILRNDYPFGYIFKASVIDGRINIF